MPLATKQMISLAVKKRDQQSVDRFIQEVGLLMPHADLVFTGNSANLFVPVEAVERWQKGLRASLGVEVTTDHNRSDVYDPEALEMVPRCRISLPDHVGKIVAEVDKRAHLEGAQNPRFSRSVTTSQHSSAVEALEEAYFNAARNTVTR